MIPVKSYAALSKSTDLEPFAFERRAVGEKDVLIDILYCGVCHSDIHMARSEWGPALYPLVPGHEIVGRVSEVGAGVTKFKVGDFAGVGVFVDSCRTCDCCKTDLEQYCENGMTGTYNGYERDGKTVAYGGYSSKIVVNEHCLLYTSPSPRD